MTNFQEKTFIPSKIKTRILQFYVVSKDGKKLSKHEHRFDADKARDKKQGDKIEIGWKIVKGDK